MSRVSTIVSYAKSLPGDGVAEIWIEKLSDGTISWGCDNEDKEGDWGVITITEDALLNIATQIFEYFGM